MATNLVAFHGSQAEKDAILKQLQMHHDADEIVKGQYWGRGKGCAVGCTIHGSNHALYKTRFGIPEALAHLEDGIFENLPNGRAKEWPLQFMQAIPVGADLSHIQWLFLHRILTDEAITPGISHPSVKNAVAQVATLVASWAKGDPIDESAAESAARSAAESAWSAESAARSAAASAAWSAESAAESAAWSAAWSAAESAARSAAESAWSAAWSAAYVKMADVLLDLLASAPQAVAA